MRGIGVGTAGGVIAVLRSPTPALLRGRFASAVGREAEQRRLFPWLAVAFGIGILLFFGLADGQPWLPAPWLAGAACLGLTTRLGERPVARAAALATGFVFLGFAAAAWRVERVAAPVLARTMIAPLTGLIEALDEREEGARLIVRVETLGSLSDGERPQRVRVSFRKAPPLRPGDRLTATARLMPPPEAARPGGYDFARDAYFQGIGAVGSLIGPIAVAPAADAPPGLRLAAALDDARNTFTRRIAGGYGGQPGAVAAALVTGKRGLIGPAANDALRAAGIYHVVLSSIALCSCICREGRRHVRDCLELLQKLGIVVGQELIHRPVGYQFLQVSLSDRQMQVIAAERFLHLAYG